jgi:YcxB-like protein
MRVEFEFTHEDLVEVQRRALQRSKAVASFRRREWAWFSLISAAFAFLLFFGKGWTIAVLVSVLSALIAGLLYPTIHKRVVEARVRKLIREKLDPNEPLECEVELTPAGLWIRQGKTQITHEWGGVESISSLANGIEIITRSGGLMVRNRAFSSEDERTQFLQLANSFLASATLANK